MITVWDGTDLEEGSRIVVAGWMEANGVNPREVALAPVYVDGDTIRYTGMVLSEKGNPQLNEARDDTLKEPRTAPLAVPWSPPWSGS